MKNKLTWIRYGAEVAVHIVLITVLTKAIRNRGPK